MTVSREPRPILYFEIHAKKYLAFPRKKKLRFVAGITTHSAVGDAEWFRQFPFVGQIVFEDGEEVGTSLNQDWYEHE
jgi:hypothetical protein